MCCLSHVESRHSQRGLTLVELLVSMLILGLVMTLVAQAVSQTAQVARVAQESSRELHSSWNKGWAARELLTSLVAPPEAGERPFQGSADTLSGFSLRPMSGPALGVKAFKLRLTSSRESGEQQLVDDLWETGGVTQAAVVARFDGAVEFAFQDAEGSLHEQWPTASFDPKDPQAAVLPSAVLVRERDSHKPLLWFPFQGDLRRQNIQTKMFWEN